MFTYQKSIDKNTNVLMVRDIMSGCETHVFDEKYGATIWNLNLQEFMAMIGVVYTDDAAKERDYDVTAARQNVKDFFCGEMGKSFQVSLKMDHTLLLRIITETFLLFLLQNSFKIHQVP